MADKKVLYIDFDSTIVNSEKAVCGVYNERYEGRDGFEPADWMGHRTWTFKYVCPIIHEEFDDPAGEVTRIFESDDFFTHLEFYPDAEEVLEKLCEAYDVVICTSSTPQNASKKVLWIEERLPLINEILVVINRGSNGVGKGRVHMIEKDSIFIDDHPHNLHSTKAEQKYLFRIKPTEFSDTWDGEVIESWQQVKTLLL